MYKFKGQVEDYVNRSKELNETNDCAVKALAKVLDTSYDKAHKHLREECKRKNRKGIVSRTELPKSLKRTKFVVGEYSKTNRITVNQFCEKHPTGRFYVCVRGHAFAIVDGCVYDYCDKPRRQITWAMRIYID